jgi:hypothetical protein
MALQRNFARADGRPLSHDVSTYGCGIIDDARRARHHVRAVARPGRSDDADWLEYKGPEARREEASIMEVERRGSVILPTSAVNLRG